MSKLPSAIKSKLLIVNRHSCCVCGKGGVQIHHINGDSTDHRSENLAVLCLEHHSKASAPPDNMTAALSPQQIRAYKCQWEQVSAEENLRLSRSRTAFHLSDYKNAERIRDLFAQLTPGECQKAAAQLRDEFVEEDRLRIGHGLSYFLNSNFVHSHIFEEFIEYIKRGDPHPQLFKGMSSHPCDRMYPDTTRKPDVASRYYDQWCRIMVRAILAARGCYDLENLMRLKDPIETSLAGNLVSFEGVLRGKVALPDEWKKTPVTSTWLTVRSRTAVWQSMLKLKTHYIYGSTSTCWLRNGIEAGLFLFRNIDNVRQRGKRSVVRFSCTPLIIGSGTLRIPSVLDKRM